MRKISLLPFGVIGVLLGLLGQRGVLSLGSVVGACGIIFVVVFAWVSSAYVRNLTAKSTGPVPCARCEVTPRTESGWCAPCTARLSTTAVPAHHPIQSYVAGNLAGDVHAMADYIAPRHTTVLPNGRAVSQSHDQWLRRAIAQSRWSNSIEGDYLAVHHDPDDRSVAWTRLRARGRLYRIWPLDLDSVTRHHLDVHGRIDESRTFRAL